MLRVPKQKIIMTQSTFIHLCWKKSILVNLYLHHLKIFIII